jgi:hypothetical protein
MDSTHAVDRPGRVRAAALLSAVPIAVAVLSPFGAHGSTRPLDSSRYLSARTSMFGDCHGTTPQARLAAEVTVSTVGALKWPGCAGD